jgi:hypothetical protein
MPVVHITQGSGKLKGIMSINTPASINDFCLKVNKIKDAVCGFCYSLKLEKMRPALPVALEKNMFIVERPLTIRETPIINSLFFRFDSFGELHNIQHFLNLIAICNHNPDTTFALWTKRANIVHKVFDLQLAVNPANLILVFSTLALDSEPKRVPRHFDKVFAVFTRDYLKKNDTVINCYQSCNECRICYTQNGIKIIREVKK